MLELGGGGGKEERKQRTVNFQGKDMPSSSLFQGIGLLRMNVHAHD